MSTNVSLSFDGDKDAMAIATVKGGKYNKETLYLHQSGSKGKKPAEELDISHELIRKLPHRRQAEILRELGEAFEKGVPVEHLMVKDKGARSLYEEMLKSKEKCNVIKLPLESSYQLIPVKDPKKRSIWYIAGASGSGKSHIAKGLAENYMKFFPDRPVY